MIINTLTWTVTWHHPGSPLRWVAFHRLPQSAMISEMLWLKIITAKSRLFSSYCLFEHLSSQFHLFDAEWIWLFSSRALFCHDLTLRLSNFGFLSHLSLFWFCYLVCLMLLGMPFRKLSFPPRGRPAIHLWILDRGSIFEDRARDLFCCLITYFVFAVLVAAELIRKHCLGLCCLVRLWS